MIFALQFFSLSLFQKLFLVVSSFLVLFILYGIYKLFLRPLARIKHYRKQGINSFFFPLIGDYKNFIQSLNQHGDILYHAKMRSRIEPQRIRCFNLGSDVMIVPYDTALIKEFYLNSENYIKDPFFLELYSTLLGKGLVTSEGAKWKTHRKILSNVFHFEFLKATLPSVQKTAHETLHQLRDISLSDVNIMDVFQKITGEVVGKIFFGEQLRAYQIESKSLTVELANIISQIGSLSRSAEKLLFGAWFMKQGILPKHKRLMDKIQSFRGVCRDIITERKKLRFETEVDQTSKDMLDLLLEYNGEEGKIEEEEIIDQFVTFFMAGMDTTGHLVTMAVYLLEKYPEFKAKMIEEVKTHYTPKERVDVDDLNKLEFTTALLKETLRTVTPVPGLFPRKAVKDHMLGEFHIRKGDCITTDNFYNSFNEDYFKDSQKFNPLRWLGKEKIADAYAFIPFSAGPRNCIGQHLAMNESKIILAEFFTMYDVALQKDYQMRLALTFLYEPEKPVSVDLKVKKIPS